VVVAGAGLGVELEVAVGAQEDHLRPVVRQDLRVRNGRERTQEEKMKRKRKKDTNKSKYAPGSPQSRGRRCAPS
jgi:hypothetical protein